MLGDSVARALTWIGQEGKHPCRLAAICIGRRRQARKTACLRQGKCVFQAFRYGLLWRFSACPEFFREGAQGRVVSCGAETGRVESVSRRLLRPLPMRRGVCVPARCLERHLSAGPRNTSGKPRQLRIGNARVPVRAGHVDPVLRHIGPNTFSIMIPLFQSHGIGSNRPDQVCRTNHCGRGSGRETMPPGNQSIRMFASSRPQPS